MVAAGVREEVARYRLPSLITLTRDNHHILQLVLLPCHEERPGSLGPGTVLGHCSTVWYGRHDARKKNEYKIINRYNILWHWWLVTLVRRGRVSSRSLDGGRPPRPACLLSRPRTAVLCTAAPQPRPRPSCRPHSRHTLAYSASSPTRGEKILPSPL